MNQRLKTCIKYLSLDERIQFISKGLDIYWKSKYIKPRTYIEKYLQKLQEIEISPSIESS